MQDFFELSIDEQVAVLATMLKRLAATNCKSLGEVAHEMELSPQAAWDQIMTESGMPTCSVPGRLLSH